MNLELHARLRREITIASIQAGLNLKKETIGGGEKPEALQHEAVNRAAEAINETKTIIIDPDLRAYFDNVQHYLLLEKVAKRIQDDQVMRLLKIARRVRETAGADK